jgi:Amt family ammonium transporter
MMLLGCVILWVGWYGFNPGSTLAITGAAGSLAGKVAVMTTISPAFAALTMISYQRYMDLPYDLGLVINAVLAGLVSITASCAVVEMWAAMLIGIIGCFVYLSLSKLLLYLKIDDPLDASPVHMGCGIWGTLAVGIFGNDDNAAFAGYPGSAAGYHPFRTGEQLGVQIVGIICIVAWTAGWSAFLFYGIKHTIGLRVSEEVEDAGLDTSEHGTSAYNEGDIQPKAVGAPAPVVEVEKGEYSVVATTGADAI